MFWKRKKTKESNNGEVSANDETRKIDIQENVGEDTQKLREDSTKKTEELTKLRKAVFKRGEEVRKKSEACQKSLEEIDEI